MKITNGELCTQKFGDEFQTFSVSSNEKAQVQEQERYSFALVEHGEEQHFTVKLSEEEIKNRVADIRAFYEEGMIPWICPTCGKLWGANYDAGTIRWFQCHFCGAEWEMANEDEVDKYLDNEKRKLYLRVVQ